jgi:serine/threonine protein kinase
MTTSPPPNFEGTVVGGRYRVDHLLGQGGMGSVWAGEHVSLGQKVAIKFLHPKMARNADARRRFENEARAAARINSRHAVKVHDHGVTDDGHPFIVMEYLEGKTLEWAVRERGPLLLPEVATIFIQVARALDAAHEAGIVHRDLKPDNIFLANDPEAGRLGYTVKVVDFGIAKLVHEDTGATGGSTQAGALLGTPHYMSPEALTATSPVLGTSDVWSLGASAFFALTGQSPFSGDVLGEVVLKVCSAPMPVPSKVNNSVPHDFDAWFAQACARLPSHRFQSAREAALALQQLEQWASGTREQATFEVRPTQRSVLELELGEIRPAPSRGKTLGIVLALAALAIGGGGLYAAKVARDSDLAMMQMAASANAAVDRQNQEKQEAQRRAALAAEGGVEGGVEAGAPAPSASTRHR